MIAYISKLFQPEKEVKLHSELNHGDTGRPPCFFISIIAGNSTNSTEITIELNNNLEYFRPITNSKAI